MYWRRSPVLTLSWDDVVERHRRNADCQWLRMTFEVVGEAAGGHIDAAADKNEQDTDLTCSHLASFQRRVLSPAFLRL